jgi:hypothetical protein
MRIADRVSPGRGDSIRRCCEMKKRNQWFMALGSLVLVLSLAACGPAAVVPAPTQAPQEEAAVQSPTEAQPTPTVVPPTDTAPPPTDTPVPPTEEPAPTPLPTADLEMELPEGMAERGAVRAVKYRCAGCHVQNEAGLPFAATEEWPVMKERGALRIADPAYAGIATTSQEYTLESILVPEVYVVPGDWGEAMPTHLGVTMSAQDIADVLAWIETLE